MIEGASISLATTGQEWATRVRAVASDGVRAARSQADAASAVPATSGELTAQELQQVAQLKQIDRQVRAHEQAHLSVGGDLVRGGASFSYQLGPDQQRYAVAGEVSIDVSAAATPQKTLPKAEHIRETALAPVDPSAQDQSIAAQAERMASEARMEIAALRAEASATTPGNPSAYLGSERSSAIGGRLDLFA